MTYLGILIAFALGLAASTGLFRHRTRKLELERANIQGREEALESARSRFFAAISHELRSPLTLSMGALEGALEGRFGALNPDALAAFERAQRNNIRLVRRIDQLLDLSRLDAGVYTVHPVHDDVVMFLETVIQRFESTSMVTCVREGFDTSMKFSFDPAVVEKMLLIVLSLTADTGKIWIGLHVDGFARITVRGAGSAEPRTEQNGGAELELELIRKLAAIHRGAFRTDGDDDNGFVHTLRFCPLH